MINLISKRLATSAGISRDDFDYSPLSHKGGLPKAWGLFESELDIMINELNRELVV